MMKAKANYKVRKCNNVEAVYSDVFDKSCLTAVLKFDTNIIESRYHAPIFRFLTQYLLEQKWKKNRCEVMGVSSNINCNGILSICVKLEDDPAMGQARLEKAVDFVLDAVDGIKDYWLKELGSTDQVSLNDLGLPAAEMSYYADRVLFDTVKEAMRPDGKTPEVVCSYDGLTKRNILRGAYHKFLVRLFSRQNVRMLIYVNSERPSVKLDRIADTLFNRLSIYRRPKMINWPKRQMIQDEVCITVSCCHLDEPISTTMYGCALPFSCQLWATIMVMNEIVTTHGVCEVLYFDDTLCLTLLGDTEEAATELREFVTSDYTDIFTDGQVQLAAQKLIASKQYLLDRIISGEATVIDVDAGSTNGYQTGLEIDMIESLGKVTKEDVEAVFRELANSLAVVRGKVVVY